MARNVTRTAVLLLAALLSLASSFGQKAKNPEGPPTSPPQDSRLFCHGVAAGDSRSSLCYTGFDRCQRERETSLAGGIEATECTPAVAQIACFQLRGDPNPQMAMCARTVEDCELWRLIENDKHGASPTQAPCALAP
jgi:hypothetical protein